MSYERDSDREMFEKMFLAAHSRSDAEFVIRYTDIINTFERQAAAGDPVAKATLENMRQQGMVGVRPARSTPSRTTSYAPIRTSRAQPTRTPANTKGKAMTNSQRYFLAILVLLTIVVWITLGYLVLLQ